MLCPHCKTENRDDRVACYHCGRDLTLLRLIWNKAKAHFNTAVQHAEEGSYYEALGELNNALELNSQMIEAHVLRGSILARLDRSDEARDALNRALSLRPNAARAHKYLQQVDQVQEMVPLVRRLRGILAGAGAAVFLALLVAVLALFSGPDEVEVPHPSQAGWIALQEGNLEQARQVALSLEDQAARKQLEAAINLTVQTRLDAAARLAMAGEAERALEQLAELEEMSLPQDLESTLARQREAIRETLLAGFRGFLARTPLSDWERASEELTRLQEVMPSAAEDFAAVRDERLAQVTAATAEELDAIDRAISEGVPADEVRRMLSEMASAVSGQATIPPAVEELLPGVAARAQELTQRLREREARVQAEALLARATEAARDDREADFREAVSQLRALEPPQTEALQQAEKIGAVFTERQRAELMAGLTESFDEQDSARAVELAESLEQLGVVLEPELRDRVEESRRALAIDSYYALMDMAGQIESGDLTNDDAQRTLRLVRRARGMLPPRLEAKAKENLHFFSAAAHRALGDTQAAEQEIEALRSYNPQSAWLLVWDSSRA